MRIALLALGASAALYGLCYGIIRLFKGSML